MANPPTHFFKFVPPGFLFNLSIPSSFLTKVNGKQSCSQAILKRGRHEWSVDIDDGVFGEGWRRFVRENGVQELDFIVFKHQGSMVFDFLVFDQSTCEKHYQNLFDIMEGEEHLTESETIRTHGLKKLKKRKRNDYASEDKEKFQVDDSGCFMSKMTPYVIDKSRLHVPIKFARSNGLIPQGIRTQVYLMDDTQSLWPAALQKTKKDLCLTGWREFIVEKHLKVGDVCRFELVKHRDVPVFKCYIVGKDFVKNHIQVKESSSTLNNHPYFISNLKPTSFKRWVLNLPVDFSMPNGLKTGEMILRDDKGRSWKVHLNKIKEKYFYLGQGLRDFLVANAMKEGDAFKFELVEKKKGKPPIVNFLCLKSNQFKSDKEAKSVRKKRSILCDEGLSYFVGKLKSCSIGRSLLFLPKRFARSNGLTINNKTIILKNGKDERSWTVELRKYKDTLYYIGRGWKDFRVANKLKKGDHFKFELVRKGEKPIVNFHIQRIP